MALGDEPDAEEQRFLSLIKDTETTVSALRDQLEAYRAKKALFDSVLNQLPSNESLRKGSIIRFQGTDTTGMRSFARREDGDWVQLGGSAQITFEDLIERIRNSGDLVELRLYIDYAQLYKRERP